MQYLRLGDLTLAVTDGVHGFEEQTGYNYATQAIATGKPILQGMGQTLAELTLNITLRQSLGHDVPAMLNKISTILQAGKPERLVLGNGTYQGDYVIVGVTTTILRTNPDGEIVSADLALNLTEYADRVVISQRNVETRPAGTKSNRKIIEK